jgi:NADPH:quinone reductase-like Zn-dependent oxidoreductase
MGGAGSVSMFAASLMSRMGDAQKKTGGFEAAGHDDA